ASAVESLGLGDRAVNQGPSNVGYVLNMLATLDERVSVERLGIRFLANVFAGDVVLAGGTVDRRTGVAASAARLACSVWLDVEGGPRVLEGDAVIRATTTRDAEL